jgi:hypothetical protein
MSFLYEKQVIFVPNQTTSETFSVEDQIIILRALERLYLGSPTAKGIMDVTTQAENVRGESCRKKAG